MVCTEQTEDFNSKLNYTKNWLCGLQYVVKIQFKVEDFIINKEQGNFDIKILMLNVLNYCGLTTYCVANSSNKSKNIFY